MEKGKKKKDAEISLSSLLEKVLESSSEKDLFISLSLYFELFLKELNKTPYLKAQLNKDKAYALNVKYLALESCLEKILEEAQTESSDIILNQVKNFN